MASETLQPAAGMVALHERLRARLCQYLEAQLPLRDDSLVAERRALIQEGDAIAQEPYLESTPTYRLGRPYAELDLPDVIGETLAEMSSWAPGIGVFERPFEHQAQALEAFFRDRADLIVASGTGSGKTETFLFPILGQLLLEAAERPATFAQPGCRALLLYPMNALVQDQLLRLRRLLGDERTGALFRQRYGRPARFGTYTGRTPYAGPRTADRDRERVGEILDYYLHLVGPTASSDDRAIARELQERGRWPAKDLAAFLGAPGRPWKGRLVTAPDDRELLTRHEMQATCPDVLVTNYSMLEYMLLRPIERTIFEQTRAWLDADTRNTFLLVLDEAHVYRGVSGAEVALLIRRLQARLGIPRERMRCILTSASLGDSESATQAVKSFALGLTGQPESGSRFHLIRGAVEDRPLRRPGTPREASALARLPLPLLEGIEQDPAAAWGVSSRLLADLGLLPLPAAPQRIAAASLRGHLADGLAQFGPLHESIALTTGIATAFSSLPGRLFPDAPSTDARAATDALLTLGSIAQRQGRPLLATRTHLFFRGLPPIFACIDAACPLRRNQDTPTALLGRLYAEPRSACACPRQARVYEVATHRDCGAAYLRVYGEGKHASFYWHESGGRLDETGAPLEETLLLLEPPHPQKAVAVAPIWLEIATGRALNSPPTDSSDARLVYRLQPTAPTSRPADDDDDDPGGTMTCPACTRRAAPDRFGGLETRGERPFANLIREQILAQPPARPADAQYPNAGRKVLLFSDGRQRAARLARDLPREVEHDVLRQALVLAARMRGAPAREVRLDRRFYAAFVAIAAHHRLHFFDGPDQQTLLQQIRRFEQDFNGDFESALDEEWEPRLTTRFRQGLLRQVADPYFAIDRIGVGVLAPAKRELQRIQQRLEGLPSHFIEEQLDPFVRAWIVAMLRRTAFDPEVSDLGRLAVSEYYQPVPRAHRFRVMQRLAADWASIDRSTLDLVLEALCDRFTEPDARQAGVHLDPAKLSLQLAVDDLWRRCLACNELQHHALPPRCLRCNHGQFEDRAADDPATRARLDYYRQPIRDVLRGTRPFHVSAEEHTAQLSHRDSSTAQTTTEEYELRFQDVWLGPERPPIDVLSCTTTMEVGVDIGSLVAIGLRNVPPRRENYQQRAGRAGRRGSALSSVLTFAHNGPHDGYYFAHPGEIVAGDPREPMITVDNPRLATRHIHAYLIQRFFGDQLQRLPQQDRTRLETERVQLFSALGPAAEFFGNDPANPFTLAKFRSWLERTLLADGAPQAREIAAWLPTELALRGANGTSQTGLDARQALAIQAGREFLASLVALADRSGSGRAVSAIGPEGADDGASSSSGAGRPAGVQEDTRVQVLDLLFDEGLLPSYAFPVDLASFAVFGVRDGKTRIVEKPQQQKAIAIGEYAPGRLLVIDKQTYRVGGIFLEGDRSGRPGRSLFANNLERYVGCDDCGYVRLGQPQTDDEPCPICQGTLVSAELLDPPGYAPAGGMALPDHDRDEELSYATGARLPTPVDQDRLTWRDISPQLQVARAPEQLLVTVNAGPKSRGFVVCETCAAAWPSGAEPRGHNEGHDRPFPPGWSRFGAPSGRCRGTLRQSLYLGYTFRTDLLVARLTLNSPFVTEPQSPWLLDAFQSVSVALALAATRILDIDPMELQPGFRLLSARAAGQGATTVDIYLHDTADGGAGYAAEAAARIGPILDAALRLAEACPEGCPQSCTRCMRHYGNRFIQNRLDRHLAASLLRYARDGASPLPLPLSEQADRLASLAQFLKLEGCTVERDATLDGVTVPLLVRGGPTGRRGRTVAVGVQPALLDEGAALVAPPWSNVMRTGDVEVVLIRDYVLLRDLPSASRSIQSAIARS